MMDKKPLFCFGRIDDTLVSQIYQAYHMIEEDEVIMYINSGGGEQRSLFALLNLLLYGNKEIHTFVVGQALSAACILAICGAKRYCTPLAKYMYHEPQYKLEDGMYQVVHDLNWEKNYMLKLYHVLEGKTGQLVSWWEQEVIKDRYTWLTAEDAKELCFVDHVGWPGTEYVEVEYEDYKH